MSLKKRKCEIFAIIGAYLKSVVLSFRFCAASETFTWHPNPDGGVKKCFDFSLYKPEHLHGNRSCLIVSFVFHRNVLLTLLYSISLLFCSGLLFIELIIPCISFILGVCVSSV